MLKKTIISLFIAISFLTPFAMAEEKAEEKKEEATKLGEVVVTAPRVDIQQTLGAFSLDDESLASMPSFTSDTASLLRDVPGVSLYGAGGVSSLPVIHGMADDRLRIKVDGMDLISSCPNHMNPPLSYIDPTNVGNIKVFAGITPVSVGGDSIGGTIIVETPAPEFAAQGQGSLTKGEIGAFYRSNGNAFGANLSATYATESFNITYDGSAAESDNYEAANDFKTNTATGRNGHTLPLDEVGSTAYRTWNHTLGFAIKKDTNLFEVKFGYQDIPYQLYPNQRMDMLDNEQKRVNLRYLSRFKWGSLDARAYYEKVDHYMDFGDDKRFWYGMASGTGSPCGPIGTSCASGMPMYTEGETTGAAVRGDINLSEHNLLRLGSEIQFYRLDDWWPPSGGGMWPGTFWNINDGKRDRMALFSEWESHINPQWLTLVGVRYERVNTNAADVQGYNPAGMGSQGTDANAFNSRNRDKTDNNWDMTALARYTANANSDIEFGFARKVRSPNLYERYAWSTWSMAAVMNNTVGDGNGYWGDIDLKPEKAHTVSATFDLHTTDRGWEFKATPYYTRVTDYIDAVQWNGNAVTGSPRTTLLTNQFVVLRYVNQSAQLYGIDLSGSMPIAKTGWGDFGLKGLLNYTKGKNRDTDDDLYNIMPLNGKLTLTHKIGGWDNGIEFVMVDNKDDVSDMRNEIKTSGYNLVNLRASYSWKQVRFDFGIENLFDESYDLPTGGAYVGQGRTMSLNPTDGTMSWGTTVPGMARSIYTGLTIKF